MKVLIEKTTDENGVEKSLYLESDEFQFILKRYNGRTSVDKKSGKEIDLYDTLGYFTNIHFALNKLMKMKIMQSTAANLDELLIDIKRIEYEINRMWSAEVDGKPVAV